MNTDLNYNVLTSVETLVCDAMVAKHADFVSAYDAEVKEWYENGDGRSAEWVEAGTQSWFDAEWDNPHRMVNIGGRGYTFPHCIHGTSLWTDYDNICGGCEHGEPEFTDHKDAAQYAVRTYYERLSIMKGFLTAAGESYQSTLSILNPMMEWVNEPVAEWFNPNPF